MNPTLTDLGFEVPSQEAFAALAQWLSAEGETLPVPNGFYLRCPVGKHIEFWMQFDQQQRWAGMNLHFNGEGRMRVRLAERVERSTNLLDGAFFAWSNIAKASPLTKLSKKVKIKAGKGASKVALKATKANDGNPIVFDMPDFHCLPPLALPTAVDVQLAGFSLDIRYYSNVAEFDASVGKAQEISTETFLATGLFRPVRGAEGFLPPDAVATLSATVLRAEYVLNPVSNRPFIWALAQTEGGTIDLLIAADTLPELPSPGGVLFGNFMVSGRLLPTAVDDPRVPVSLN